MLGGAGLCGVTPGQPLPSSHQGQTLCATLWSPGPSTSSQFDVFLDCMIFAEFATDASRSRDSICVSRRSLVRPFVVLAPQA